MRAGVIGRELGVSHLFGWLLSCCWRGFAAWFYYFGVDCFKVCQKLLGHHIYDYKWKETNL